MAKEDLTNLIEARLGELGLSKSGLARSTGISRQGVHKLLAGDVEEAKISTFLRLAAGLECDPLSLMQAFLSGSDLVHLGKGRPRRGRVKMVDTHAESLYPGDASRFVADVTIADNSLVAIGASFTKTWRIKNAGTVAWEGRRLRCADDVLPVPFHADGRLAIEGAEELPFDPPRHTGLIPCEREVAIPYTPPGGEKEISVEFRAPLVPGCYFSYWKAVDTEGQLCFPRLQGLICMVRVVTI